jgi:hypothetical protein
MKYSTLQWLPPMFSSYRFECCNSRKSTEIYDLFIWASVHCLTLHISSAYTSLTQQFGILMVPSESCLPVVMPTCSSFEMVLAMWLTLTTNIQWNVLWEEVQLPWWRKHVKTPDMESPYEEGEGLEETCSWIKETIWQWELRLQTI